MTGCMFASSLAGHRARIATHVHVEADPLIPVRLSDTLDVHGGAEQAVVLVFPRISSEPALVDLLNALAAEPRWAIERLPRRSPTGAVLVRLGWTTSDGATSDAMGFAPFASMPVPRRSPYVAIAIWPGARANPFRGSGRTPAGRSDQVGFLDMPHDLAAADYDRLWSDTAERVGALMAMPPDDATLYRRAGFLLSPEHATRLVGERG